MTSWQEELLTALRRAHRCPGRMIRAQDRHRRLWYGYPAPRGRRRPWRVLPPIRWRVITHDVGTVPCEDDHVPDTARPAYPAWLLQTSRRLVAEHFDGRATVKEGET